MANKPALVTDFDPDLIDPKEVEDDTEDEDTEFKGGSSGGSAEDIYLIHTFRDEVDYNYVRSRIAVKEAVLSSAIMELMEKQRNPVIEIRKIRLIRSE